MNEVVVLLDKQGLEYYKDEHQVVFPFFKGEHPNKLCNPCLELKKHINDKQKG